MAIRKRWNREELLVMLNLYHKLRFGQFDARNPVVIALASKLGRGANSLAMKLGNLASLDPALKLRGIVLSPALKHELSQRAISENFGAYEGEPLHFPKDAVLPKLAFLA